MLQGNECFKRGFLAPQTSGRHKYISNEVNSLDSKMTLSSRTPMYTQSFTGHEYIIDFLNRHSGRAKQAFRIEPRHFLALVKLFEDNGVLCSTRNMTSAEQLTIFLKIVSHCDAVREVCELLQYSNETISRVFNKVLDEIYNVSSLFIKPRNSSELDRFIVGSRYDPVFQNALGAIDGTHISAIVRRDVEDQFRNRKGYTSQNVLVVVGFDRMIHFVNPGWGGSAAYMTVLRHALRFEGFTVPNGKYYLVDSGYANTSKFIAPHRGQRYHLAFFRMGRRGRGNYSCPEEFFNYMH